MCGWLSFSEPVGDISISSHGTWDFRNDLGLLTFHYPLSELMNCDTVVMYMQHISQVAVYSVDCWCISCHFRPCQQYKINVTSETSDTTHIGSHDTYVLNTWNSIGMTYPGTMSNCCPHTIRSTWKAAVFKGQCVGIMCPTSLVQITKRPKSFMEMWHSFLLSDMCYEIQIRRHCIIF